MPASEAKQYRLIGSRRPKTHHLIAPNARSKAAMRSQVTCASAVAKFRCAETVSTVNTSLNSFQNTGAMG
jgi:hypothetical protein